MTRYEIRKGDDTPCKLVSVTKTSFGGDVVSFICSGTYTYCKSVKDTLK